jgi:hypothetical protein
MEETDIEPSAWPLPPEDVLNAVIDTYFPRVQPWLPILHEGRFRRVLHTVVGRQRNTVVLHAMFVATRRYLSYETLSIDMETAHRMEKRSRDWVLRSAMSGLSVENLQASTIIAFIDVR